MPRSVDETIAAFCKAAAELGLRESGRLLTMMRDEERKGVNLRERYARGEARRAAVAPVRLYDTWVLEALQSAVEDRTAASGALLHSTSVVRLALIETIDANFPIVRAPEYVPKAADNIPSVGMLPTLTITPEFAPTVEAITKRSAKLKISLAEYIRNAVAYWLKEQGYAPDVASAESAAKKPKGRKKRPKPN